MQEAKLLSPVSLPPAPAQTENRGGWEVVLAYKNEAAGGPRLADLSHVSKWDLQDSALDKLTPWGMAMPAVPGGAALKKGKLILRLNRSQCSLWALDGDPKPPLTHPGLTETTHGLTLLAFLGLGALDLLREVTRLDLADPGKQPPFLLMGPVMHVPSQVAVLSREGQGQLVLVASSRGYGQSLAEAYLETGFKPAGEAAVTALLK